MSSIKARALAVGALALALAGISATPALAVPPADGVKQVVAVGGSDTIEDLMTDLAADYNVNTTANPTPNPDDVRVIPNFAAAGTGLTFNVPAGGSCPSRTYIHKGEENNTTTFPAPNGSGDGKNALNGVSPFPTNNQSTACIDIGRSSAPRGTGEPTSFEYYAFALDAVSWAHFPGGPSPASLSVAEIQGIFNCTFTDWSEVGGTAGPIQRYYPQANSGTRNFFTANVLGGSDPTTISDPANGCPAVIITQENDLRGTVGPDTTAEKNAAISPFSVGQWIAQGNGEVPTDQRNGSVIGLQDGSANPVNGTSAPFSPNENVIKETPTFIGVRYVFNILDNRMKASTDANVRADYNAALRFVGFDDDGSGYLCDGNTEATSTMRANGFVPLPDDGASNCRLNASLP